MDRHFKSPFISNYNYKDYDERYSFSLPRKFTPIVTSQAYREIKTKSLVDDFYSNLIDWYNDKVYFAIDDSVFIHDFHTSKTSHLQTISDNCITSVKGMGNKIILGTSSGYMHIVDICKEQSTRHLFHKSRIGVLKIENTNIFTGSRDKRCKVIDSRINKIIHSILQHNQEVCGMDLSKNYKHLVTGGNDNKLYVYDRRNLDVPLTKCTQHKAAIKAVSWSPVSANLFVTGGGTADKTVKLWDINLINNSNSSPLLKSVDYGSQVCNLKWLHNNQILSTHGYSKDDIRLCGVYNFNCNRQYLGHKNRVIHFSVSKDEKYFVTGSADCSIKFWEIYGDTHNEIEIR
ncbi:hypothetical protein NCER_100153 [Vairimorpha ceranae BRL01]|uniref:CDC20/Fizzy WD40 domain-containing protein n=2 Tax=Vairimorpha ceranae TaxID=40302 RepID=C4V6V6_VAIC1|nr:wd40 domain-containing protein [Vairimorpha ceranae]EEQ83064.1 hypothetical protein NCER_100153 [Vairimorpha ceranae BRL01]KAF5140234.1 hypothetical protein G9O61_00g016210 [Vairimorpha ceranae]KKO76482.1 wd40 domain-containing protein [Vairimorpha ceranae]